MKLKVLKYDKVKARWFLALLKFSELFVVFLLVFGFHGLGSLVYNNFPEIYYYFIKSGVVSFGNLWFCGFGTFIFGLCGLCTGWVVVSLVYIIFKAWFKANWRWAQVLSEDKKSKQERLKEKEKLKLIEDIEEMNKDRERWGYCRGDIAFRLFRGTFGKVGDKYEITYVDNEGNFNCKEAGSIVVKPDNFRFIKKPIPKKPKLSPMRQKELDERKK